MLGFYEFVSNFPSFKRFEVDELLFTTYDCPIEASPLDYWTRKSYFTYLVSGSVKWKTPVQEIFIGPGEAVFVRKGMQRVYRVEDSDLCALLIFVPDEFIKEVIQKHKIKVGNNRANGTSKAVIPLEVNEVLAVYFESLRNYFTQPSPPSKALLKVKFEELIVNILTGYGNQSLISFFEDICFDRKQSVRTVMETHFIFNLSLKEFADLCGMSLSTFKREFARTYRTSPGKWLKTQRLEYGKFLLETTDLNISQITLESGFENASHFVKVFRETYQYPPLQFKKLLQKG